MPQKKNELKGNLNKYTKLLGSEWMEEVDRLDASELKKIIIEAEQNIVRTEKERDADMPLKDAKQKVKDLSGGYGDAIKYQTAKIKYALTRMEEQGKA